MKKYLITTLLVASSLLGSLAQAQQPPTEHPLPFTPGVGQANVVEPATIGRLGLGDPLIQDKYLNNPDLLRFLRGTYAEACTRGLMNESVKMMKANVDGKFSKELVKAAAQVLEANRIWKLTSLEMESLFGTGYVHSAFYCDCMLKELTDQDLVNPAKGLELIDGLPISTQATCERLAVEKSERYKKRYMK